MRPVSACPAAIAHGISTMAQFIGRAVTVGAGALDAVVDLSVRFTRPVVVLMMKDGHEIEVTRRRARSFRRPDVGLELTATCAG